MFWCTRLKEGDTFCVCESGWKEIRFSDVVFYSDSVKLFVQPEYGYECVLFHLRNGETSSHLFNFKAMFQSLQHVKLKLLGGELTLIGDIYPLANSTKRRENEYPLLCPFNEIEVLEAEKMKSMKDSTGKVVTSDVHTTELSDSSGQLIGSPQPLNSHGLADHKTRSTVRTKPDHLVGSPHRSSSHALPDHKSGSTVLTTPDHVVGVPHQKNSHTTVDHKTAAHTQGLPSHSTTHSSDDHTSRSRDRAVAHTAVNHKLNHKPGSYDHLIDHTYRQHVS